MAAVRDVTAQAKSAYYQIQLDLVRNDLIEENVTTNLERVLKVTLAPIELRAVDDRRPTARDHKIARAGCDFDQASLRTRTKAK
jgi:hypothetical protein